MDGFLSRQEYQPRLLFSYNKSAVPLAFPLSAAEENIFNQLPKITRTSGIPQNIGPNLPAIFQIFV